MNAELFQLVRGRLRGIGWLAIPLGVAVLAYFVCISVPMGDETWPIVGIVFVAALLLCGLFFFVGWIRKKRRGASLEDALGQGPDGSVAQQGEINALRKQWRDSLTTLKGSGVGGGGKGALAALPWFVIIGEPASGKSTLLRQSGIDFPVGDAAVRGLQGTRNCDWWFSNIGVFLDTAGRYVSDASAGEWASFLELVRKHRTGAPINGVIVAIPAPDLVSKNLDQLDLQARQIRARLDELIDHLGVNFPVWVTLTKVDLIAGFAEFFGQADAQTRRQMMGWTLDQAHGMRFDRGVFDRYYQATVHRLREIRPVLIEKAKLRDRPAAFAFPDELGAMGHALGSMLAKMFEPNVYQDTPFFRGLYVTSATQQGTPLQRAAQHIREMLGAPGAPPDPHQAIIKHAYFVKDFMNERVVSDREMTWTTKREIERNKTRRLGQNLAGASLGVLITFLVLAQGLRAKRELEVVSTHVEEATRVKDSSAVERTDDLWIAAAMASDDLHKNLALSKQANLKKKLRELQFAVYENEVLEPLVAGFEADLGAIEIEGGLAALIASWEQFHHIKAALDRARRSGPPERRIPVEAAWEDGKRPTYADDSDETIPWPPADSFFAKPPEPAEGSAPGDISPSAGTAEEYYVDLFRPEEVAAFTARGERLKAEGVVGRLDGRTFPTRLLVEIWRNGSENFTERLAAIRAAYMTKLDEYLRRAEKDLASQDAWRNGFRDACQQSLDLMRSTKAPEQDALLAKLDLMRERARTAPPKDESDAAATDRIDSGWRGTLGAEMDALVALRIPEQPESALVKPDEYTKLVTLYPTLEPYFQPGAPEGGADLHLRELAAELEELGAAARKPGGLAAGGWEGRGRTISDVLTAIDAEVDTQSGTWTKRVVPHLWVLSYPTEDDYTSDRGRWGLGVELIQAGLLRNDLLRAFLESAPQNCFPALATEIVESRNSLAAENPDDTANYNQKSMSTALRELALVAAATSRTSYVPRVAATIQERAADEVDERFGQLVDAAQAHWDKQCRALPTYTRDPAEHLRDWADPKRGVGILAKRLEDVFNSDWGLSNELQNEPAARAAWTKTVALRTRYAFFWEGLAPLQKKLEDQLDMQKVRIGRPEDLRTLDGALPRSGDRRFSSAELLKGDTVPLIPEAARRDLDRAYEEVLYEVLQNTYEYFDSTWTGVAKAVANASTAESVPVKRAAMDRLDKFADELEILFGASLAQDRGGLRVIQGFQGSVSQMSSRLGQGKQDVFTGLSFRCEAVPFGVADTHPYIVLEYRTKNGGEVRSEHWEPNDPWEWNKLIWREGEDYGFTIYMVRDDGRRDEKVFRSWPTMREAIKSGGGLTGNELVWSGTGDFKDSTAKFTFEPKNRAMFSTLMGVGGGGNNTGPIVPPDRCVELQRR